MAGDTDSIETLLERPAHKRASASGSAAATSGSTSVVTPELAQQAVDARRAWAVAAGLCVLCVIATAIVLYMGGDPLGQRVHIGALLLTGVLAGSYAVLARDLSTYRAWHSQVLGYISITTIASGYFYWGVFSAYAAVVPLSAYAFASSAKPIGAWLGCALCVISHAGLGAAQLAGWVAPHGLVTTQPFVSVGSQVAVLVLLQLLVVAATLGGIDAKKSMANVLVEHHVAQRALAQRDALLAEARAQMRDARAPGEGRYTGQQLGRFRLGAVLGRGAMGEVYDATDDAGGALAVKVLAAHHLTDADIVKRFHREARAISVLDAPNIVRMIEVSPPNAALPYLAMEKLDGNDLGELIQQQPRRELAEVVTIIAAVAAGLDAAHAAGVVHRDLKPANIFATTTAGATGATGTGAGVHWKVLDFGVSKLTASDATATMGHVVGTPGYMAPEQARGDTVDHRADVYSLGVVAYRLLTGTPAIVPGELPAMIHEVVYRMPPRPSSAAELAPAVEAVLAIALAKAADDRFDSAGALAAALAAAAADALPAALDDRARDILRRTPWGAWLRR